MSKQVFAKFRYSLRWFLILLLLLGITFAVFQRELRNFHQEQAAVTFLTEQYDGLFFSGDNEQEVPIWNWGEWKNLRLYKPIEVAEWFNDGELTPDFLNHCYSIRHINDLRVSFSTDGQTQIDFSKFHKLTKLVIEDTSLRNQEIISIGKLKRLSSLTLRNCSISDESLRLLSELNLVEFNISENRLVTDDGIEEILFMSELKKLILSDTSIRGTAFQNPKTLPDIRELSISDTDVGDDTFIDICDRLASLEVLSAKGIDVTDRVVPSIMKHPSLSKLRVGGTKISAQATQEIIEKSSITVF